MKNRFKTLPLVDRIVYLGLSLLWLGCQSSGASNDSTVVDSTMNDIETDSSDTGSSLATEESDGALDTTKGTDDTSEQEETSTEISTGDTSIQGDTDTGVSTDVSSDLGDSSTGTENDTTFGDTSVDSSSETTEPFDSETDSYFRDSDSGTEIIPVCPVPGELVVSDPGILRFPSVDVLLVVDNSSSIYEEMAFIPTAVYTLVQTLAAPTVAQPFDPIADLRVGIVTTDMGVAVDLSTFDDVDYYFDTANFSCKNRGDDGRLVSSYPWWDYTSDFIEGMIPCDASGDQCPPGWECEVDEKGRVGGCVDPLGDGSDTVCPSAGGMTNIHRNWSAQKALQIACQAHLYTGGCAIEQPFTSAVAALENNPDFLRANALTIVVSIGDADDCSAGDAALFTAVERSSLNVNLECGRHNELLVPVAEVRNRIVQAKTNIGGAEDSIVFAAFTGVPTATPECEGAGDGISGCFDVRPGVNGNGTVREPDEVVRQVQPGMEMGYFEYACKTELRGGQVAQAEPAPRVLELVQHFGEDGYVASVCNENWSSPINELARQIAKKRESSCHKFKLPWHADTQTAASQLVMEFWYQQNEYNNAPECSIYRDWEDGETVREVVRNEGGEDVAYWVRECVVPRISSPLLCAEITEEASAALTNETGWRYCENPEENNSFACSDGVDNDSDGQLDTDCLDTCPYKVELSFEAQAQAALSTKTYLRTVFTAESIPGDCRPGND